MHRGIIKMSKMKTKSKVIGVACIVGAVIVFAVVQLFIGATSEYFGLDMGEDFIEGLTSAILGIAFFWYAYGEMQNGR
jgi:membrane-associated HD superfamily phosphohydrolase